MAITEKFALITGANSGLGKATAVGLARQGYTVVMVARSQARGEAARRDICAASGSQRVHLLLADLASQQAIRALVQDYTRQYDRLHVLVNNVGNSFMTRQTSPDGIEMSLAVNHLAAFLLTNLLLPTLHASAPARIVNVGTRVNAALDFDDLQVERTPYRGLQVYSRTKLGALHFTFALAQRLAGSSVTVNCVHPGVFRSNLGRNSGDSPLWMELLTRLSRPFLTSPERAAERVLYLATAPELAGISGKYYGDRVELPSPPQTLDAAARQRLWDISAALTGLEA
ncbi:MAG: SDR family NAD(P)-dependent oxidoreductase [Anaerolineae bacterium]|nr:SDR family NAD(P)-dependent oxidoreductase [Anaerolineae bacterium]